MKLFYFFIQSFLAQVSYLSSENNPDHTFKGTGCFELDESKIYNFYSIDNVIGQLYSEPGCKGEILATGGHHHLFYHSVDAKSLRILDYEEQSNSSDNSENDFSEEYLWGIVNDFEALASFYNYYPSEN
jgi:hypothetical protein